MERALRFLPASTIADMFLRGAFIDLKSIRMGFFAILYRFETFGEFVEDYGVFNTMAGIISGAVPVPQPSDKSLPNPVDGCSTNSITDVESSGHVQDVRAINEIPKDVGFNSCNERSVEAGPITEGNEIAVRELTNQIGGGETRTGDDFENGDEDEVFRGMAVEFISDEEEQIPRFRFGRRRTKFRLNPLPENTNPVQWIQQGVEELLDAVSGRIRPNHKVGLSLMSERHPENIIHVPWMMSEQLNTDNIMAVFERVSQSNSDFFIDGEMIITIDHARPPRGFGRVKKGGMTYEDWKNNKRSIISISNKDDLCLARALVVAIAHVHREDSTDTKRKWNSIRRVNSNLQAALAVELCNEAGVDLLNGGGIEELQKFQSFFGNKYKIIAYNDKEIIFEGVQSNSCNILTLLYSEEENNEKRGHYDVVTSVTALKAVAYFCNRCEKKFFNNKSWFDNHICINSCPSCHNTYNCDQSLAKRKCAECGRFFYGEECFFRHKNEMNENGESVCNRFRTCGKCFVTFSTNTKRRHECGVEFCNVCRKPMAENHLCYIQPSVAKKGGEFIFIFYDFECTQDTKLSENAFEHVVNLCVSQQVCYICYEKDIKEECKLCGVREKVFKFEPVKEFVNYLRNPIFQMKFKNVICIAHNARGYDAHFILKYVIENLGWTPSLIMDGMKILSMRIPETNMSFIDSLSFLPMPLSGLPKTFGLPNTFKKGYFPHLFNKERNKSYVGPIPDICFYQPDSMKSEEREKFLIWHKCQREKGVIFDFSREIVEYCVSDVTILRLACMTFHRNFLKDTSVDPFCEAITIAGACNKVFRRKFMQVNSIGIIPRGGYRFSDNQSVIAIKWLCYEENKRGILINHAGRGLERKIMKHKVDGFYENSEMNVKQIFQFHGCFWHGHECMQSRNAELKENVSDTLNIRREKTRRITELFKCNGYEVIEMWECDFLKFLAENPEVQDELNECPYIIKETINPREAFFGGRTNAVKLYHKANTEEGEKIKYLDICSLYPFICKYGKYPIGHPKNIYVEKDSIPNIATFEGILKCTILPPENLYHPVLPVRIRKKLIFTLCRMCAEENIIGECRHDVQSRSLTGTWIADEIRLALTKGYKISCIHEAWEYEVTSYSTGEESSGGLFHLYINSFLKLKQESSGWPEGCVGEEEKREYLRRYKEKEGIDLDPNMIEKNPGRRALAKLMLNSFWGKFGQRENKVKTSLIKEPKEFFKIISSPSILVNSVVPINNEMIYVNSESVEDDIEPLGTVNVVIAAYTTSLARIKLYHHLERLGRRILYYDTDSIIFTEKPGEWSPPTGEYLGDLTDELLDYGKNSFITEFVSGGPKNYAFVVACGGKEENTKKVCKVKGITLNHATSQRVNFENLKKMVLGVEDKVTVEYPSRITRTKLSTVYSYKQTKTQKIVYNKRQRINDFETLPFGYKRARTD